jgi:hypothetical protein
MKVGHDLIQQIRNSQLKAPLKATPAYVTHKLEAFGVLGDGTVRDHTTIQLAA